MFYNGWVLFACLAYSFGGYPSLAMKLQQKRMRRSRLIAAILGLLASAYVLGCGIWLLSDWTNPFAGKGQELSQAVHRPKEWIVVAMIVAWPYLLILVGLVIGYLAGRDVRWATRSST
jgi:H+/Cl- antiporter ClcA